MELFLAFAAQQWILIGLLIAALGLLVVHEGRKSGPSVSPQQAINMVNKEDGVFVDLRDGAAFKQGHIVEARHIPAAKLEARMSELDAHKDKPVVLVCKMGQQASAASKQLQAGGYSRVYKMSGGMMEWASLQLPTVTKD